MALTQGHKLDANTLALWRLDETAAGALFADASGKYPVTTHTGGDTSTAGLIADGGKARLIAPAGTPEIHAATDAAATTAIVGACTVEAWIQLDPSWAATAGVALHQVGANPSLSMEVLNTRALRARWTPAGSFDSTAALIPLATRTHVAVRKNSGTSVDLFVNGVKVFSGSGAAPTNSGAGDFTIGGAGIAYFNGIIDDVRWSSVARTDAEIAESYWRGLLDISPGPTQAPFRQARTPYQDFHRQLSPTALLNPQGAAFEAAQGALKDAMFDRCLQSVKAKYPSVAPGDALAAIGADRMMPRGGSETDAAYAARLLNAWNTWPWAGTAYGLLQAFFSTGYRNVVLAQVRGGKQFTLDNGGVNLLQWSGDLSNAAWTKGAGGTGVNAIVTKNFAAAPDGTTTAARVQLNQGAGVTSSDFSFVIQGYVGTLGTSYATGVWLKTNDGSTKIILLRDLSNFNGTLITVTGTWQFFKVASVSDGSTNCVCLWIRGGSGTSAPTADLLVAYPQAEPATTPGPYAQTYGTAKPTALAAGSLLTSTMASGIWETDPLSSYSPASQSFWSKFDVLFPLPLMPPSWGWSGGIPGSGSVEANFIRSLAKAWAPAHATCDRIVIVTQGNVWGYPASQLWGASTGLWGSSTNVVWTP